MRESWRATAAACSRIGPVDGPVVAGIITASVALTVAIGGAVRSMVSAALDRRYERRRTFLIEAQDAMLVLREALDTYGAALVDELAPAADVPATDAPPVAVMLPADAPGAMTSSFSMDVAGATTLRVKTARGRLAVARSRVEDDAVDEALGRWETAAQASLISPRDVQTVLEEAAFAAVNELIRAALRSVRARTRRR